MPNWVSNTLNITVDTAEKRAEIMARLGAPVLRATSNDGTWEVETEARSHLSYWNIIAPPADKYEEYFGLSGWKDGERHGDGEYNWYNWNNANWGCKWDATEVDVDTSDYKNNLFNVTYHFESPWSPPEGFFAKLAEAYPDADMSMEFREEQGWGGELQSTGDGQISLIREWDIPASHQDWIDSGDEDGCVCLWGDGSHYDDCPEDNWKEKESE